LRRATFFFFKSLDLARDFWRKVWLEPCLRYRLTRPDIEVNGAIDHGVPCICRASKKNNPPLLG
jgi:hypothetical protein